MSIARAILVAWRVSGLRERVSFVLLASLVIASLGAAGAIGGRAVKPVVRTVTATEYRDRVVERTVTVEKPVVQYRDRVVVRTVTKPDGTKVETRVDDRTSKTTGEKTTSTGIVATETGSSTVTTSPEGRWSVRVLAGLDTGGSVLAGVGVDYRLAGPLTVGAWGTAPVAGAPGRFAVGVAVGLRLP